MSSEGLVERIDVAIANFLGSWNWATLVLAGLVILTLLWPIITGKDPDIHPFLLARQAHASPVRLPGESAVYRANEIPIGYPLRKGLGVKDANTPKWSAGRDGDLRDVWRQAVRGPVDQTGASSGSRGKFMTVLGREKIIEQDFLETSRTINAIGTHIKENKGKIVAVSLANSVELLVTIYASAFYGFKPVLLPYGLPQDKLNALLKQSGADVFIGEAGVLELESLLASTPSIKHIIWVTQAGSTHMDWNEVPEGVGGAVDVSTWHEIVDDRKATTSSEMPESEKNSSHGPIAAFYPNKTGGYELFEYTAVNLIAGTAGLLSTLTRTHKLTPTDVVLLTTPLSESYTLCWTLAALFSNASVALNSVSGDTVDLTLATAGSHPTIIITSSGTITQYASSIYTGSFLTTFFHRRSVESGVLSTNNKASSTAPNLMNVRALLVSQRDSDDKNRLSSSVLSSIRLALGARIGYALTSGAVAGAVAQTNVLDYRNKGSVVNIGAPVTSVEVHLRGDDQLMERERPVGKIVVKGPSVIGGKAELDVMGQIDVDQTFALV